MDVDLDKLFDQNEYIGPTIVIVGPTASGKTGVSIDVAKELNKIFIQNSRDDYLCEDIKIMNDLYERQVSDPGYIAEIISADSRAIYKDMEIGTTKPSLEERQGIVHFGVDLVYPGEKFTVADWKFYAENKIDQIRWRGHIPIVVGGTGLYIDALIYDYKFTQRAKEDCSDRKEIKENYRIFGIKWGREELRERIMARLNKLFVQELFDETYKLVDKYGWDNQAMKSNIYEFVWKYLNKGISLEEAIELAFLKDWHLAKRQMTWFKRNKEIEWCEIDEIVQKIVSCVKI